MTIIIGMLALLTAAPSLAQPSAGPAPLIPAETTLSANATPRWLSNWDGSIELQFRPAIGEPISSSADSNLVDDSEYEFSVRARRPLGNLRGLRLQLQGGVVSTPNLLDADNAESAVYGEVQLGDTYLEFSELRRANFRQSADGTAPNAFRPYIRYRASSIHSGFLDQYVRTDQRATIGLRYRRIPYTVTQIPTENGEPQPPQVLKGFYFELRAEVAKVWSTQAGEEPWNPRVQFDLFTRPFWNGTRFVVRSTLEQNRFDNALAPNTEHRIDTRLRVFAGFDLSAPLEDLLNAREGTISAELLGRFQSRWSNDPGREHSRLYFVPTLTLSVPL